MLKINISTRKLLMPNSVSAKYSLGGGGFLNYMIAIIGSFTWGDFFQEGLLSRAKVDFTRRA